MEDAQSQSSQDQDGLTQEVMESLGGPEKAEVSQEAEAPKDEKDDLPEYAKKRLGMQEKRHKKELRAMQEQIAQMQAQMAQRNSPQSEQVNNPYVSNDGMSGNMGDHIQQAVNFALRARDEQERKVKDAEKAAHIGRQYQALQDHLDNAASQYDDFDDVVRSTDAPYTEAMRDASLLLPKSGPGSAAEVLYKLGKNKDELKRISQLHPLDQAQEMVKLSIALMGGNGKTSSAPKPMGQIKSNPVTNGRAITDKTPISELRQRMKNGWK